MMRLSTIAWMLLITATGYAMFQVKYEVARREEELARLNRQIAQSLEATRVLKAEWSFLNQPARLDQLARRHLGLVPIGTAQLGQIDHLPRRPPTPPAAAAAAAPPPASSLPVAAPRLASSPEGER
jgi:hypothetical protein